MACTTSLVSSRRAQEQKQLQSLKKSRGLLHQLVDALHTKGGWPLSRLHLLGYSQGGTMALALHDLCDLRSRCLQSSLSAKHPQQPTQYWNVNSYLYI